MVNAFLGTVEEEGEGEGWEGDMVLVEDEGNDGTGEAETTPPAPDEGGEGNDDLWDLVAEAFTADVLPRLYTAVESAAWQVWGGIAAAVTGAVANTMDGPVVAASAFATLAGVGGAVAGFDVHAGSRRTLTLELRLQRADLLAQLVLGLLGRRLRRRLPAPELRRHRVRLAQPRLRVVRLRGEARALLRRLLLDGDALQPLRPHLRLHLVVLRAHLGQLRLEVPTLRRHRERELPVSLLPLLIGLDL